LTNWVLPSRYERIQDSDGHAKLGLQPLKQDLVVDCIKRRRQVQTDQESDLLVVGSRIDSVENFQQSSFSGVSLPVGGLVLAEVR